MQTIAMTYQDLRKSLAERTGREQPANSSGNRGVAPQGGAESGALSGDSSSGGALPAPTDPDLLAVVAAWPTLPEVVRRKIVAAATRASLAGAATTKRIAETSKRLKFPNQD